VHPKLERARVAVIADDLTGAVDTAVRFQGAGDVAVLLDPGDVDRVDASVVAIDAASRGCDAQTACDLTRGAAVLLHRLDPLVTYKKMDSQLRGHFAHEVAAMLTAGSWGCALVAPALPEQGRAVRDGCLRDRDVVGPSLFSAFHDVRARCHGVGLEAIRRGLPGLRETLSAVPRKGIGVLVCDAETADDLDTLVRAALTVQDSRHWLWCGSSGLAGALARYLKMHVSPSPPRLPVPFLGLIGSPDPVARAQLRAAEQCGLPVLTLPRKEGSVQDRALLETGNLHLQRGVGCFLAAPPLGPDEGRTDAYGQRLAACALSLVRTARPASLILSGGDTARDVCRRLGIWGLLVKGEIAPGVPISRPLGFPHPGGLMIATKAGSFGSPELWCGVIDGHGPVERTKDVL
jgi:D-threonate/D-erythronate kinase